MDNLREYLEWLITPQNEEEQSRFGEYVDDYIELRSKIPMMTREELVQEINIQLEPLGVQI